MGRHRRRGMGTGIGTYLLVTVGGAVLMLAATVIGLWLAGLL